MLVFLLFWGYKLILIMVLYFFFILFGMEIYSLMFIEVFLYFNILYLFGNLKERGIKFLLRKV